MNHPFWGTPNFWKHPHPKNPPAKKTWGSPRATIVAQDQLFHLKIARWNFHQGEKSSLMGSTREPLGERFETWDPPKTGFVRKIIIDFNIDGEIQAILTLSFQDFCFLQKVFWNKWGFFPALELRTFVPYVLSWLVGLDNYHVVRYLMDDVDVYSLYITIIVIEYREGHRSQACDMICINIVYIYIYIFVQIITTCLIYKSQHTCHGNKSVIHVKWYITPFKKLIPLNSTKSMSFHYLIWVFPKIMVPNKPMGFPIKNDHFGVWNGGNPPFKETPI